MNVDYLHNLSLSKTKEYFDKNSIGQPKRNIYQLPIECTTEDLNRKTCELDELESRNKFEGLFFCTQIK